MEFVRYHSMKTSIDWPAGGPFPAIQGSIYDPDKSCLAADGTLGALQTDTGLDQM